jgi:hypothetical protein
MSSSHRYWNTSRSIAALLLLGLIAFAASGCGPDYGYSGYPGYGYAPYSYGWGGYGYNPVFVEHHSWEEHHDYGHHTEFYHGGGGAFVGHEGGGFHAGGGGFHGGGGGGHGGGGHR